MNLKYATQIQRNYDMFKQAIGLLCDNKKLNEEQINYCYLKAKADLYQINWDYTIYDPIGLEQAIEEYEWLEKKDKYNQSKDYFHNLGVR